MGCNCGKKTPPPPPPVQQQPAQQQTAQQGFAGRATTYALQLPSGERTYYGSRLEAAAARVRAGSIGRIIQT